MIAVVKTYLGNHVLVIAVISVLVMEAIRTQAQILELPEPVEVSFWLLLPLFFYGFVSAIPVAGLQHVFI